MAMKAKFAKIQKVAELEHLNTTASKKNNTLSENRKVKKAKRKKAKKVANSIVAGNMLHKLNIKTARETQRMLKLYDTNKEGKKYLSPLEHIDLNYTPTLKELKKEISKHNTIFIVVDEEYAEVQTNDYLALYKYSVLKKESPLDKLKKKINPDLMERLKMLLGYVVEDYGQRPKYWKRRYPKLEEWIYTSKPNFTNKKETTNKLNLGKKYENVNNPKRLSSVVGILKYLDPKTTHTEEKDILKDLFKGKYNKMLALYNKDKGTKIKCDYIDYTTLKNEKSKRKITKNPKSLVCLVKGVNCIRTSRKNADILISKDKEWEYCTKKAWKDAKKAGNGYYDSLPVMNSSEGANRKMRRLVKNTKPVNVTKNKKVTKVEKPEKRYYIYNTENRNITVSINLDSCKDTIKEDKNWKFITTKKYKSIINKRKNKNT